MGITKNRQSLESIKKMAAKAFPNQSVVEAKELTEGLCNVAYLITLDNSLKTILKIAPKDKHTMLTNEINMMKAEIKAMQIALEQTEVPVAKVYLHDDTGSVCDSEYFFMEVLEGESYYSQKEKLSPEAKSQVDYEIGLIERNISSIRGERFAFLGDEEHGTEHLYDLVHRMIEGILKDATAKEIIIGFTPEEILNELSKDRACFNEVVQPVFIHWDMWEGNIFLKDGHVSGVIDWERAMWGEILMDDRFRSHARNLDFLRGIGKLNFTKEEMQRIYWYDVFLYLTMMTEGAYREYEDDSQYQWVKPLFEASFAELQKR